MHIFVACMHYDFKGFSRILVRHYWDASMVSSLGVGEMLLMGNAVNYPVFIDVRERNFKPKSEEISLSQFCLNWQNKELK